MSENKGMENWYALHTRSNSEKLVTTNLESKEVEHYYPSFTEVHQWADRKKLIHKPLFPGYVFVRFEDSSKGRVRILQTPGAIRLLGTSTDIIPVPEIEIESIRKLLGSGCPWTMHPYLSEGAWVRVRRGALKNAEGKLIRVKNTTRLVLSVNLFSKSVATEVNASDVELIRPVQVKPSRLS
jgi:transcription antitermination factor NusG